MKNRWIRTCKSRRSRFRWSATTTGMGEGGGTRSTKNKQKDDTFYLSFHLCRELFHFFFELQIKFKFFFQDPKKTERERLPDCVTKRRFDATKRAQSDKIEGHRRWPPRKRSLLVAEETEFYPQSFFSRNSSLDCDSI